MTGYEFPIDETFISSLMYEGLLVCKVNGFNFDKIRKKILGKLKKIEKEKFEIISAKFEKPSCKCVTIDNFANFKVRTDLKKKLPKQLILLLEKSTSVDKAELRDKIRDVSFLITDVNTAKILGDDYKLPDNYLILEEKFTKYIMEYIKRYKLPSNALVCRKNEKYYLYLGYTTLRYDIPSSGVNDQYFFYYKGKSEEKGLEVDYTACVLDRKIYAKRVGILTFLKEFLEEFKSNINLRNLNLKPNVVKEKSGKYKLIIGNDRVTGLQIFGCDRFSGFTSLETDYTTSQVTIYTSPEVALILLFGLASSFIVSIDNYHYFLFFSQEDVLNLYNLNEDVLRKYYLIKDKVIEILRDAYLRTTVNEVVITELALRLELQDLLNRCNVDKVSFTLFKIALERNTYKIYEQIPIRIYREIAFTEIVERYFRNPEEFIKKLAKIFDRTENQRLWDALKNKDSPDYPEGDNVLKAMQGLYRFVILGDLQGYYQFVREIANCYEKTENKQYKIILEGLRWF